MKRSRPAGRRILLQTHPIVVERLMNFQILKAHRWLAGVAILATMFVSQIPAASFGPRQDENKSDRYLIDNAHTSIVFAISHFGLSYTYGRFNKIDGEFALNGAELTESGFSFTIKADSIDTNNEERDKHLRSPDFFDTQQFPDIKFVTKSFTKEDGVYQVVGEMTMLGKTRPLTMSLRLVGVGKGPSGKQRAGYFTKFTIKRSDFGMDKMAGQIGDNIAVTFSFEGIKQ